jgi:5,10-methylenetetrahydrofolate reductase
MTLLERLRAQEPFLTVELRPPRRALEQGLSMDAWMAMHRAVRRLLRQDTALFLTDNAVGTSEEENLHHLGANLEEDAPRERLCPFLTTKHTLEYCLWYADRAAAAGHTAITVLGGDKSVGAPRCLPHANQLRARIRERHPELALGGWANPYRDAAEQVGFLLAKDAFADFFLTQIVSHHDLRPVEAFLSEALVQGLEAPGVFGVFYYRSANPKTLARLAKFMRVPAAEITAEFESGLSADEICASTIRELFGRGVRHVYLSNLDPDDAPERLKAIRALL